MIGKLLAEGHKILEGKGTLNMERGSETGIFQKINRDYLDSLMIETRIIDSVKATTEFKLFGETFDTPVMTWALSSLGGACSDPMVKIAKGVLAAGDVMFVGIGEKAELREITVTGVKTVKIVKPYEGNNRIFEKISQAEECRAFALGGRVPVLVDGGMTGGTDVFKALALGADGVLAGYAVMAGLAAGGVEGVEK